MSTPASPARRRKQPTRKRQAVQWSYQGFIWLCGFILPPIGILVRFGVGKDLLISIILTLCGYFPSHIHAFYVQNIRNNTRRNRTPKWAIRYGLVDPYVSKRRGWAAQYDQHVPGRRPGVNYSEDSPRSSVDEGRTASTPSTHRTPVSTHHRNSRALRTTTWAGADYQEEFYGSEPAARSRRSLHGRHASTGSTTALPRSQSTPFDPTKDHDWAPTAMETEHVKPRRKSFGFLRGKHRHQEEPEEATAGGFGRSERMGSDSTMERSGKSGRRQRSGRSGSQDFSGEHGQEWDTGHDGGQSGVTDGYGKDLPAPPKEYGTRSDDGLDHTF